MNYLEFLNKQNNINKNKQIIAEAFNGDKLNESMNMIKTLLKKKIKDLTFAGHYPIINDNETYESYMFVKNGKKVISLNFKNENGNVDVYSIDFFDNLNIYFGERAKSRLTIYTMGTSIAYFLPIIINVANTGNYNIEEDYARSLINGVIHENVYRIGAYNYLVNENVSRNIINEAFTFAIKENEDETPDAKKLWKEYEDILTAIKGGKKNVDDIEISIAHNKNYNGVQSSSLKQLEKLIEKRQQDPTLALKEIEEYIDKAENGEHNGFVLCGGPNVKKTYTLHNLLNNRGYADCDTMNDIDNAEASQKHKMHIISGKVTLESLYIDLYTFSNKGDVIVIDNNNIIDQDAPTQIINIIDNVLSGTRPTKISIRTSQEIKNNKYSEGEKISNKLIYNGTLIVVTEMNKYDLHSKIRNKDYVINIDFNDSVMLKLIKSRLDSLDKNTLSNKAKEQGYKYVENYVKENPLYDLTLQTFMKCVKIYQLSEMDEDFTTEKMNELLNAQF